MILNLKNYILEFFYRRKFIRLNKKIFSKRVSKKSNKIFLVEFNKFHNLHVVYSVFSNYYKKNYNCTLQGFFNYSLLSAPLKFNILNQLKWTIGNFINLKTFAIYRSFGVDKIFKPNVDENILNSAENFYNKNFFKIKKKEDVLKLEVKNILIGDLLYDTYLKSRIIPTINIFSEDFKNFFLDFLKLYFFWYYFFKTNNVCGVVASHGVYSYGLILRIAENKKIPCFVLNTNYLSRSKSKNYGGSIIGDFTNYKNDFKYLKKNIQKKTFYKSKKILNQKFSGKTGVEVNMEYADVSSFSKNKKKNALSKSDKFKVLISTHDFFDAVHLFGKGFFVDFYEWLIFLGKISAKTNYEWYIKNHPIYGGKFKKYQIFTDQIVNNIIKIFPHIKLLPNNTSNKQLIYEGLGAVLTVYGSVAAEFPFFGIPVLNASKLNPHCSYSFSKTPNSRKEYEYHILNLSTLSVPTNAKKEIIEYHSMRHMVEENWLFGSYANMLKKIGGYHNLQTFSFYKYWLNYCDKSVIEESEKKINFFLKSGGVRLHRYY